MLSGQDFPEEVELLDQLVRSRALGADRAEHQLSHGRSTHEQRHGDLGP
jgi:hypothetical protein